MESVWEIIPRTNSNWLLCTASAQWMQAVTIRWMRLHLLQLCFLMMIQSFVLPPHVKLIFVNGEGGIRTHVTFRSNGFQDRRVMTASLLLRMHTQAQEVLECAIHMWYLVRKISHMWWIRWDSNPELLGYEPRTLTDCVTDPYPTTGCCTNKCVLLK